MTPIAISWCPILLAVELDVLQELDELRIRIWFHSRCFAHKPFRVLCFLRLDSRRLNRRTDLMLYLTWRLFPCSRQDKTASKGSRRLLHPCSIGWCLVMGPVPRVWARLVGAWPPASFPLADVRGVVENFLGLLFWKLWLALLNQEDFLWLDVLFLSFL